MTQHFHIDYNWRWLLSFPKKFRLAKIYSSPSGNGGLLYCNVYLLLREKNCHEKKIAHHKYLDMNSVVGVDDWTFTLSFVERSNEISDLNKITFFLCIIFVSNLFLFRSLLSLHYEKKNVPQANDNTITYHEPFHPWKTIQESLIVVDMTENHNPFNNKPSTWCDVEWVEKMRRRSKTTSTKTSKVLNIVSCQMLKS